MLYPFSALLARMKYITRWSLMHSTRAESLSEHTCDTALLAHLLYLLKHGFLDDDLMCIGEDGLLLKGIVPLLLVPDGVGIGLEVHRSARVLPPFQNRHNGTAVPVAGVLRLLVWGLDALQGPVCAGR